MSGLRWRAKPLEGFIGCDQERDQLPKLLEFLVPGLSYLGNPTMWGVDRWPARHFTGDAIVGLRERASHCICGPIGRGYGYYVERHKRGSFDQSEFSEFTHFTGNLEVLFAQADDSSVRYAWGQYKGRAIFKRSLFLINCFFCVWQCGLA